VLDVLVERVADAESTLERDEGVRVPLIGQEEQPGVELTNDGSTASSA
jgi:hypothetical protein